MFKVGNAAGKTKMLRRLGVATVLSLLFAASAQSEELIGDVAQRIEQMTGRTLLFRNDSDRIPQLEYLRPDGTGVVWSAALGNKVVPVIWIASNGDEGNGTVCLEFKGADIGTPQDLKMCDALSIVESGIRDVRDGDPYGLLDAERMKVALPQDVSDLAEIDRLLGQD